MSDSLKVTFNIRKLYSLLLVIFVVIPDVSSYFSKKGLATIGFIILSGILFLIGIKRNLVHIHFNFISKCVVAYIVLLTMSTLLNLRLVSGIPNQGMTGIYSGNCIILCVRNEQFLKLNSIGYKKGDSLSV
ncbi:hypothetical protein ACADC178_1768 [Lactobacillus delbrueckii subsp. lactis]|nr:hypothetical protein ACADC178_1768 [Lactobacillus delbrueckii subsp. lactis]